MNISKFNYYFKIYLILLLFYVTFFLFQKHDNNVEFTISDWLINYQGGFIRRGLLGELALQLSKFFPFTIREIIFLFQLLSYLFYFYLVFNFIKKLHKSLLLVFAIFSPLFILYPIAEVEVLARKEIFVFISFLIIMNIFSNNKIERIHYIYFSFILSICCLIWEGVILYLSYFISILLIKNNFIINKEKIIWFLVSFIPTLSIFYLILNNKPDSEHVQLICESLNECYGAITYLDKSLASNIEEVTSKFKIEFLFRYLLIFIVGFFPLILLILNSKFNNNFRFTNKNFFLIFFILVFAPTLTFYLIAQDWGRWINISYTLSLFTYLYCLKNNFINLKLKKTNYSFSKNRIILSLLLILFSFSWSPKVLINEDVGSIPLYRKSLIIIKSFSS